MLETNHQLYSAKVFILALRKHTLDDDGGVTQQSALWQWYYTRVYGDDDSDRQGKIMKEQR